MLELDLLLLPFVDEASSRNERPGVLQAFIKLLCWPILIYGIGSLEKANR